jgi:hypothetical protein
MPTASSTAAAVMPSFACRCRSVQGLVGKAQPTSPTTSSTPRYQGHSQGPDKVVT